MYEDFAAKVTAVRMETLGSETTAALVAADTVIPVLDSGDFDESGGSVLIDGEVYTYSELDEGDESGVPSITLDAPGLTGAVAAETRVDSWNPSAAEGSGAVEVEWLADVIEEGTDIDGGAGEASIDHALIPLAGTGMPLDTGKSVTVRDDGNGGWTVINIRGERPRHDPGFIRTGGLGADTVVWAGTEGGRRAQLDGIDGALEAFNDANVQTVNIDGEQNYMQGSIATAASGSRVEVGPGSAGADPSNEARFFTGSANEVAPARIDTAEEIVGSESYGYLRLSSHEWSGDTSGGAHLGLYTGMSDGSTDSRAYLYAEQVTIHGIDTGGLVEIGAPTVAIEGAAITIDATLDSVNGVVEVVGKLNATMGAGSVGTGTFRDSVDARVTALAAKRTIEAQIGATYTLDLGDVGKCIQVSRTSPDACTVTIPTEAAVAFAVGDCVEIRRLGTGAVTIQGDTGVTLESVLGTGARTVSARYGTVRLHKRATNNWVASWDLA